MVFHPNRVEPRRAHQLDVLLVRGDHGASESNIPWVYAFWDVEQRRLHDPTERQTR
jgi:hypothetical protein